MEVIGRIRTLAARRAYVTSTISQFCRMAEGIDSVHIDDASRADALLKACGLEIPGGPLRLSLGRTTGPASVREDVHFVFRRADEPRLARVPQEVRLLAYGARPLSLVYGPVDQVKALGSWVEEQSLLAVLSPHEYTAIRDVGKVRYANRLNRQPPGSSTVDSYRGLIVGQSENDVVLGWLSLLFGWNELLGRLLGYPECCTRTFEGRWSHAVNLYHGDLAIPIIRASGAGPFPWECNIFGRYFGYELLSHFPCRLECVASKWLAQRFQRSLEHNEPAWAARLAKFLKRPVVFTWRNGVFSFDGGHVEETEDGLLLLYNPGAVDATAPESALANAIRKGSRLVSPIDDSGGLMVDGWKGRGFILWFT